MIKKFLPLVGIAVTMALLIVWEELQTTKYGYEVAKLQKKITELREANRKLACRVSVLKKPQRVVQVVQAMSLELAQPLENRDRIAKIKQRLKHKNGRSTNNTILASARAKLDSRQVNKSPRKVGTKGDRR